MGIYARLADHKVAGRIHIVPQLVLRQLLKADTVLILQKRKLKTP